MPMTHTNAKGKTYYLHQGTTKTGKPKYYFAMESNGELAESIPAGFEIYENPNAQPTLSRCSERKNRLSSAACLTVSRSCRGGWSHGTDAR